MSATGDAEATGTALAAFAPALAADGFAVVGGVLDVATTAAAADALDAVFAAEDDIALERGWRTEAHRVAYALPAKHPTFLALCTHPGLLGLARAVLGDDAVLAGCNGLTMVPGGAAQRLHRDHPVPTPGTTVYLHLVVALDPFTAANGATRVVPRSHATPPDGDPADQEHRTVALPADAGAVVAYDGALLHAGSANRTEGPRRALHAFFARSWALPHWDLLASLPPNVAAGLDAETRAVLGGDRRVRVWDPVERRVR